MPREGFRIIHKGAGVRDGLLREKRLVLELTQKQVAEKAKVALTSYQKFESGERNIRTASFDVACKVLLALEMDPTAFYKGEYVLGELTIFDSEGHKYVRTGRLVSEDIDEQEAINVMRIHIRGGAVIIPLKILRAMGNPETVQFLYQDDQKRLGIKIAKAKEENTASVPKEVYSGQWRGLRIDDEGLVNKIYEMMGREKGYYVGEPILFEKGCILPLDTVCTSEYQIDENRYFRLDIRG